MAAEGSTGPPRHPWCAPANRAALDSTNPPSEAVLTDIDALVSANIGPIVGGLVIAVLALAFAVVGLIRRVRSLGRRLESLTQGSDESSLEAVLGSHLERVRQVVRGPRPHSPSGKGGHTPVQQQGSWVPLQVW